MRANDDVSFAVAPGTIHALPGGNGAGKPTLVKMIYGLVRLTKAVAGRAALRPRAARAAGVAMMFQHFSLCDAMTVAENIALGMKAPPPRPPLAPASPGSAATSACRWTPRAASPPCRRASVSGSRSCAASSAIPACFRRRDHEGRAVIGAIAGRMTKSNKIGYIGSFPIPEVIQG